MKLNRTGSNWNELERNKINENWDIIEGLGGTLNKIVSGVDWKEPVDTVGDLPVSAEVGETRMVRETIDGVSHVYRYNGTEWELIQEIDATLVNEVDRRLSAQFVEAEQQINYLKENKASKDELYRESNAKADKNYVDSKVADVEKRISEIITTPSENISEQEIIDARELKNTLGDNVRDIRNKAEVNLKNVTHNGNFVSGSDGWFTQYGSVDVVDGIAVLVEGSGRSGTRLSQVIGKVPSNEVWYAVARVRSISEDCDWLSIQFRGTSGVTDSRINKPVKNEWYFISHYATPDEFKDLSDNLSVSVSSYWPSSVNKYAETTNIMAFNLTETFGRGNEPTQEEMDEIMQNFSYFEGDLGAGALSRILTERQLKIENELKVTKTYKDSKLENLIENGNFENGRDGWISGSGTFSRVEDGTLVIEGSGGHPVPRVFQEVYLPYEVGDILYLKGEFTPRNNDCESVGFAVYSKDAPENEITYLTESGIKLGKTTVVSGLIDVRITEGILRIQARSSYESSSVAEGKEVEVNNIIGFNLTSFFGKGNEPSAEAFEKMLSQMPSVKSKKKTDIAETQRALTDYILSRASGNSGSVKRPIFVITFDDGRLSDLEIAMPFLRSRGIKATHYITTNWRDSPDYMSWEQVHELRNAGHDIQGHTKSHPPLGGRKIGEIRAEMEATNQDFIDAGFPKPRHIALPHGSGWNNQTVLDTLSEYRKTIRNIAAYSPMPYQTWDNFDFKSINSIAGDIRDDNIHLLQRAKNSLLQAYENDGIAVLYLHKIRYEGAQEYEADFKYFAEIVDYALDLDFDVLTLDEVYLEVKNYKRATNQL